MKTLKLLCISLVLLVSISGCFSENNKETFQVETPINVMGVRAGGDKATTEPPSLQYNDLTYRKLDNDSALNGTSKVMNVSDFSLVYAAKLRGSLITWFGAPLYETDDAEDAFSYAIEATDQNGQKWLLSVYEGPSGFAIGGKTSQKDIEAVAYAFEQKLSQIPPADFERNMIYKDFNKRITYGCKDRQCYSTEK
jgi:hypothetical protein